MNGLKIHKDWFIPQEYKTCGAEYHNFQFKKILDQKAINYSKDFFNSPVILISKKNSKPYKLNNQRKPTIQHADY